MKILQPSIPFDEIVAPSPGDSALKMVKSLSDDQARYALWATLVMLFGSRLSNAPGIVVNLDPKMKFLPITEAQAILMQIGCGKSNANLVKSRVQELLAVYAVENN